MKKKLVASLAAAMVLGVAGTSFAAANPFADVPAKHWAYDSVMKLTQSGIVDGYGDGTFKGDKTITRYEMAQIVAKAMARSDKADAAQKAAIDKLAAEFAEELNVLGVRVSSLEKKVGTVKVTGDARVRAYAINNIGATARTTAIQERFRLNMTADINDNTSMYARVMMGHNTMGTDDGSIAPGGGYATPGVTAFQLSDAAFTTKNAFNTDAAVTLGRFSQNIGVTGYLVGTTGFVDGVKATAGKDVKVTAGYASFKNAIVDLNDVAFATATYNTSKATTLVAGYFKEVGKGTTLTGANANGNVPVGVNNSNTYDIGLTSKIDTNFAITGEYTKNTYFSTANAGGIARISYKGVNAQKPGSWGAFVEYYKMQQNAGFASGYGDYGTGSIVNFNSNKTAIDLVSTFAVAKNMTMDLVSTFNTKTVSTNVKAANYERININYMF